MVNAPLTVNPKTMVPETVLFALDLAAEVAQPVGQNWTRLDVIKHGVTNFVNAKRWSCTAHKFGLLVVEQDTCKLTPLGATSNADRFLQELQALQPSTTAVPAIEWQQSSSGSSSTSFDLGSLIAAAQPLQQVPSSTAEPLHGGVLTPSSAYNSSSGSSASSSNTRGSEQQQLLRVVLVYCRSRLPAPVWQTHRQAGLAVDCLHVHDKPQPGEQQHQLQEVYSTLESLVDKMAMRAGHASLIYESTARNLGKLLSCMSVMLSHPAQRPPQALAKPPVDLAAADLQPLPSDAANLASGVPIMSGTQLPAAAAGAWARPLGAGAGAAGASSMSDGAAAPSVPSWLDAKAAVQPPVAASELAQYPAAAYGQAEAAAQEVQGSAWGQQQSTRAAGAGPSRPSNVVTGVPVGLGCVQGVPDADALTVGMDLQEGVVLGLDASRTSSGSAAAFGYSQDVGGSRGTTAMGPKQAESNSASDAELEDLAESLRVSAVERQDMDV